jgi:hypothetical protein
LTCQSTNYLTQKVPKGITFTLIEDILANTSLTASQSPSTLASRTSQDCNIQNIAASKKIMRGGTLTTFYLVNKLLLKTVSSRHWCIAVHFCRWLVNSLYPLSLKQTLNRPCYMFLQNMLARHQIDMHLAAKFCPRDEATVVRLLFWVLWALINKPAATFWFKGRFAQTPILLAILLESVLFTFYEFFLCASLEQYCQLYRPSKSLC